jgi:glutathione S-transferase
MRTAEGLVTSLAEWRLDWTAESAREVVSSVAASAARGFWGARVGRLGARPRSPLVLFEKEPCPRSRLVREALSMLDLDAEMRPCPEGELAHRAELRLRGGTEPIPFLLDPNSGARLSGSAAIVRYLFEIYGDGRVPRALISPAALRRSWLASAIREHAGGRKVPSRRPELPLELYGYESGPRSRLVREQLSALALPWISRTRARGSPRRRERSCPPRLPCLHDPNTDRSLGGWGPGGSDLICAYLSATYARPR